MFSKIVLCATNNKLIAGRWKFGKLLSHQVFENNQDGHEDFGRFLQKYPDTRIYLLADAVEEDYRLETMPHTMGPARRELIERKLNQLYRNSAYRTAHFINRETEKRKDDRFLFAALTSQDFVQVWVDLIEARKAPLVGVYLLPMVSQHFLKGQKNIPPHLLLSERLSAGLRQSYLHNGHLRISRLAPFTEEARRALNYFYVVEMEKTRLYLISQRYITRDTALAMLISAHQQEGQAICHDVEQEQGMNCATLDIAKLAQRHNLDPVLLRDNPELLHMHLVANGTVPDNLAPAKLAKHHQLSLVRHAIHGMTAALLLIGLGVSGYFFMASLDNKTMTEQALLMTRAQDEQYQEVARNFPATPIPASDLLVVAELEKSLLKNASLPHRSFEVLSSAIASSPEIIINRLNWRLSNEDNPQDKDTSGTVSTSAPASAAVAATFVPDKTVLYEVVFMNGEIRRFGGNYRAALESVNRLVERLRANPAVAQVLVIQAPVNVSSYTNLKGSTTDERTEQAAPALFKLRVTLKREESLS